MFDPDDGDDTSAGDNYGDAKEDSYGGDGSSSDDSGDFEGGST